MFGEIQGIAGPALPSLKSFEIESPARHALQGNAGGGDSNE